MRNNHLHFNHEVGHCDPDAQSPRDASIKKGSRASAVCACVFVCMSYLSHKDAVLLWWPRLVPYSQLQHVVAEIPAMDMSVDERLVPLRLTSLFHCFCPSFALVTVLNETDQIRLLIRYHGLTGTLNLPQPAVDCYLLVQTWLLSICILWLQLTKKYCSEH